MTRLTVQTLAPEDVRVGDFVIRMHVVYEVPSFLWCCDATPQSPELPVRYTCIPRGSGIPLRIRSVCLPYLFVQAPSGRTASWDVRLCMLGRVPKKHARRVWKSARKRRRKRGKHAVA